MFLEERGGAGLRGYHAQDLTHHHFPFGGQRTDTGKELLKVTRPESQSRVRARGCQQLEERD